MKARLVFLRDFDIFYLKVLVFSSGNQSQVGGVPVGHTGDIVHDPSFHLCAVEQVFSGQLVFVFGEVYIALANNASGSFCFSPG